MKNKEGNTKIFQSFCFCHQLLLPLGLKERHTEQKEKMKMKCNEKV
jgi:hypothetical protein